MSGKDSAPRGFTWTSQEVRSALGEVSPVAEADAMVRFVEAARPLREDMDEYAMAALEVGWRPDQCCVKHQRSDDGTTTVETFMVGVAVVDGYITGHEVYELASHFGWEGERLIASCTGRFLGLPRPT